MNPSMNPSRNQLRNRSHQRFLQAGLVLTSGVLPLLLAGCGGSHHHSSATASPVASSGQCPGNLDNTPFGGAYSGSYSLNSDGTQDTAPVLVLPQAGTFRLTASSDGTVQATLNQGGAVAATLTGTATLTGSQGNQANQASFTATGTLTDDAGGTATVELRGTYRIDACVPKVDGDITVTDKGVSHSYFFYGYPATS